MKKRKDLINELRSMSLDELFLRERGLLRELFNLRNDRAINKKLDDPSKIKKCKVARARVLTVMRERKIGVVNG